jgi:vancomycin resistance protein YoaR
MTKKHKIALIILLSAIFLLLVFSVIGYIDWNSNHKDKLLPKTKIGLIDLSNQNYSESEQTLTVAESNIRTQGISFKYGGKTETLPLEVVSLSADIPESNLKYTDAIIYDKENTLSQLFNQRNTFFSYLLNLVSKKDANQKAVFSYTPLIIEEWLLKTFPDLSVKPEPAFFSLSGDGELINNKEKIGKEINIEELINDLDDNLSLLINKPITIKTRSKYPEVKQSDLEPLRNEVQKIINNGDLNIYFTELIDNKEGRLDWKIKNKEIITWISADRTTGEIKLSFNIEKIKLYLTEHIATDVNKEATLPRFEMKNGKVSSWQSGKSGREINLEESAKLIAETLTNSQKEINIIVNEISIDGLSSETDFNIQELIGTGHSDFSGSPANRRHNIKVGADAIHGMLIKPGDEFSLVQNLGEIDASSGYLTELVIKGNKTIPEYGGGLCQIGTTVFRAALSSGLPITARRNHSYRVSYYEPAGTDAAVYDPWPDVRFLNDTGNYILIQARISGNNIYFEFWGKKDGRIATTTAPTIYNIVKPQPTKLVETDTLKPGEKKCTERAHNGADAYFDYTVIYPEGATTTPKQEVRFKSHYVPWQEVCLIGKSITTSTSPVVSSTTPISTN